MIRWLRKVLGEEAKASEDEAGKEIWLKGINAATEEQLLDLDSTLLGYKTR